MRVLISKQILTDKTKINTQLATIEWIMIKQKLISLTKINKEVIRCWKYPTYKE